MNIFKLLITVFLISFYAHSELFCENPCNIMVPNRGDGNWGSSCLVMPENYSLNIYSESKGDVYGTIKAKNSFFRLILKNGESQFLDFKDLTFIGNQGNELIKTEKCFNSNYVRVFWNTSENDLLYISKEEAINQGAYFSTYRDQLLKHTLDVKDKRYRFKIGVNINKSCLNLRQESKLASKKNLCALGNDWNKNYETIIELQKVKGNWAKVKYFERHPADDYPNNDEDCFSIKKNIKNGWMKAIDDNGFPNLWFSVSSY